MRLGKGIVNQNMSVIPFNERADFNPANMTPDTLVWRLIDAFTTHNGDWNPNDSDPWAIDQWARDTYLFPPNDPKYNREGGADHHLQICVQGTDSARLNQAGVAYSSDGPHTLQPATASVVLKTTLDHGWANIPIYGNDEEGNGSTSYPPIPGPWSMTKAPGMADILTGAGLPVNNHVTTFGVWQAIRWGDLQPTYTTLRDALLGEAARHWKIELNPNASLQRTITQTGAPAYVPVTAEYDVTFGGVAYVAQAGEHMTTGDVRVWYCPKSNYGDIRYETR